MKKRILAMLLVLCLVMSVAPVTVLAAETKCPYDGTEHTLENCEATLVLAVPAENCQVQSYDLYKCDACGDLFADNFGDFGEHNLVLIDQDVDALVCGVGLKCDVLGCDYVVEHQYDCTGKCVCGAEGTPGHNWDLANIVISKEPDGCKTPGEATYTCKACKTTKVAPVIGKHVNVKEVEGVEPECNKSGLLAHSYCDVCDTYWVDGVEVEKEDLILAPEHTGLAGKYETRSVRSNGHISYQGVAGDVLQVIITIPANTTFKIAHRDANNNDIYVGVVNEKVDVVKIVTLVEGDYVNIFNDPVNGAAIEINVVVLSMENDVETWIEPSCGDYGFYQVFCSDCEQLVTVKTVQVAHDWVLDEWRSQPATCEKYGYEFWICDECGEVKDTKMTPKLNCMDTLAEALAYVKKNNLEIEDFFVEYQPATCTAKGSYQWVCDKCGEDQFYTPKALGHKLIRGSIAATKCTPAYTYYYCANEGCAVNCDHSSIAGDEVIDEVIRLTGLCVHQATKGKTNPRADHAWELVSTSATCVKSGYEIYKCVCGEDKIVAVKAYGHSGPSSNPDDINHLIVEPAKCYEDGYSGYYCADCYEFVYITKDVKYVQKDLMSIEEALFYHDGIIIPDYEDWNVVPSCEKIGYVNVNCTTCLMNEHLDIDEGNDFTIYHGGKHYYDYNHPENPEEIPAATCEDQKFWCSLCGEKEYVVKGTGHDWSVPAVAGDCYTDGHEGYGICSKCDAERTAAEAAIIPGVHNWSVEKTFTATCKKWGGIALICERDEMHSMIIDYVPNTHYVGDGGTIVLDGDPVKKCVESGVEKYKCSKCSYKYEVDVVGLGYHVNWSNYRIYPEKCLQCNLDVYGIKDWFGPLYAWYGCQYCGDFTLTNLGKDATCTEDGYYVFAYTCGHTGYQQHVEALGHKWSSSKVTITTGEYAHLYKAKVCEQVGYYGEPLNCTAEHQPETLNNVQILINNDLKKDEVLHDGALVTITVSLKAYAADMFGYSFDLNYDPTVLQLVDYAPLSELFPYNANVNTGIEVITPAVPGVNGAAGTPAVLRHYVRVMGQKYADGKNAVVEGTEQLVNLTFKVVNSKKLTTALEIHDNLEIYKNQQYKVNGKTYQKLADVSCINRDASHELSIRMLMDANNDGEINYLDCATVWQLYSGVLPYQYAENLDLNHNGEIDHVDANLIYKYFAGYISYAEVLNYEA